MDKFPEHPEQRCSSECQLLSSLEITMVHSTAGPRSTIYSQYQVYQVISIPEMSVLYLSNILHGLVEILRKNVKKAIFYRGGNFPRAGNGQ